MRRSFWLVSILVALVLGASQAAAQSAEETADLPDWEDVPKTEEGGLEWEDAKELGIDKETFRAEDLDDDGELTQYDYKYGVKSPGQASGEGSGGGGDG